MKVRIERAIVSYEHQFNTHKHEKIKNQSLKWSEKKCNKNQVDDIVNILQKLILYIWI